MESLIHRLFIHQWERKIVAIVTATVIWLFVSHTIIETKTIPAVPIRLINIPSDKTAQGLLSNGFLLKRTTLTLNGTKNIVEQIEPGDLEVILDASHLPNDSAIQINKKNVISLNPNIDISKHITYATAPEFVLKMSPLVTEKISIKISNPIGEAPQGYQFLDAWPMYLYQTVSGPHDQVIALKKEGIELTFNLSEITKEQLDAIFESHSSEDEILFPVPEEWKKVTLPHFTKGGLAINDPNAKNLQLVFLKNQLIPIKGDLPVHPFYPLNYSQTINPETYPLTETPYIQLKNGIHFLSLPLFAGNVSHLFYEVVKNNLEIDIIVAPKTEREKLEWALVIIGEDHLEDAYVALELSKLKATGLREDQLRARFKTYKERLSIYLSKNQQLNLDSQLGENKIEVYIPNIPRESKKQTENAR